jgi:hypothetical protein
LNDRKCLLISDCKGPGHKTVWYEYVLEHFTISREYKDWRSAKVTVRSTDGNVHDFSIYDENFVEDLRDAAKMESFAWTSSCTDASSQNKRCKVI